MASWRLRSQDVPSFGSLLVKGSFLTAGRPQCLWNVSLPQKFCEVFRATRGLEFGSTIQKLRLHDCDACLTCLDIGLTLPPGVFFDLLYDLQTPKPAAQYPFSPTPLSLASKPSPDPKSLRPSNPNSLNPKTLSFTGTRGPGL